MNSTIVSRYATFVAETRFIDLPELVIQKAREVLIDHLGVSLYGAGKGELSQIVHEMIKEMGTTRTCLVIGSRIRADSAMAALANSVSSHSIELDDGHRHATSHPAAVVIPTALAVAEETGAGIKELIRAIVLGYEIMLRVATAINPSHLRRGFHSTGTCGPFGAAVAAACLYELEPTAIAHALAISGLQSAGFQEMLYSNPMIKPIQPGKAAMAGVISARMAAKGAKGPISLFEGDYGFFNGMTDHVNEEALFAELGREYEIMRTYTKLYPTCRHAHCSIDLALVLRDQLPADRELIQKILVETYDFSIKEVGQIWHPRTRDEAMFSMPYAVATALLKGHFTMEEMETEALQNTTTSLLSDKVSIKRSEEMDAVYPAKRGARMTVTLADGSSFQAEQDLARGEPDLPISVEELKSKFNNLASVYLDNNDLEVLWDTTLNKPLNEVCCDEIFQLVAGK